MWDLLFVKLNSATITWTGGTGLAIITSVWRLLVWFDKKNEKRIKKITKEKAGMDYVDGRFEVYDTEIKNIKEVQKHDREIINEILTKLDYSHITIDAKLDSHVDKIDKKFDDFLKNTLKIIELSNKK